MNNFARLQKRFNNCKTIVCDWRQTCLTLQKNILGFTFHKIAKRKICLSWCRIVFFGSLTNLKHWKKKETTILENAEICFRFWVAGIFFWLQKKNVQEIVEGFKSKRGWRVFHSEQFSNLGLTWGGQFIAACKSSVRKRLNNQILIPQLKFSSKTRTNIHFLNNRSFAIQCKNIITVIINTIVILTMMIIILTMIKMTL